MPNQEDDSPKPAEGATCQRWREALGLDEACSIESLVNETRRLRTTWNGVRDLEAGDPLGVARHAVAVIMRRRGMTTARLRALLELAVVEDHDRRMERARARR